MPNIKFIAELCQNHQGNTKKLLDMVDRCADNGADIVKMQSIYTQDLVFRPHFENGIIIKGKIFFIKIDYSTEHARLKKLEINYKDTEKFINRCIKKKVIPMTTCFSRNRIQDLFNLGFEHIKVASYDCGSFRFLKELSKKFKNLIVSTGATYDSEILEANSILKKAKVAYSFLHCVTLYPTPLSKLHLSRIKYLQKLTSNVGFSDHSRTSSKSSLVASKASIVYGAKIIERHVTILEKDQTRDGVVSITPEDIKKIKDFSTMSTVSQKEFLAKFKYDFKGNFKRSLSDEELLNRRYYKGRFGSFNKKENRFINNWEEVQF